MGDSVGLFGIPIQGLLIRIQEVLTLAYVVIAGDHVLVIQKTAGPLVELVSASAVALCELQLPARRTGNISKGLLFFHGCSACVLVPFRSNCWK